MRASGPRRSRPSASVCALAATPAMMRALVEMALSWSGDLAKQKNRFAEVMPAAAAIFRDPEIQFHVAYFDLGPDEALIVEARPPACDYWMFVLSNHWLETLDYTRHRITLNNHSAVLEPDGTVKVIVAARDPGHPNWLDTAGHARGTIGVRWVGKGVAEVVPSARWCGCRPTRPRAAATAAVAARSVISTSRSRQLVRPVDQSRTRLAPGAQFWLSDGSSEPNQEPP